MSWHIPGARATRPPREERTGSGEGMKWTVTVVTLAGGVATGFWLYYVGADLLARIVMPYIPGGN